MTFFPTGIINFQYPFSLWWIFESHLNYLNFWCVWSCADATADAVKHDCNTHDIFRRQKVFLSSFPKKIWLYDINDDGDDDDGWKKEKKKKVKRKEEEEKKIRRKRRRKKEEEEEEGNSWKIVVMNSINMCIYTSIWRFHFRSL